MCTFMISRLGVNCLALLSTVNEGRTSPPVLDEKLLLFAEFAPAELWDFWISQTLFLITIYECEGMTVRFSLEEHDLIEIVSPNCRCLCLPVNADSPSSDCFQFDSIVLDLQRNDAGWYLHFWRRWTRSCSGRRYESWPESLRIRHQRTWYCYFLKSVNHQKRYVFTNFYRKPRNERFDRSWLCHQ